LAESWLFCFDPTQDPRFRRLLKGKSDDYQVNESPVTARQESVLNEMINRIRRHSNLGLKDRSSKPLIVACTKFDAWSKLFPRLPQPWGYSKTNKCGILDLRKIKRVSDKLKSLLHETCPEVVNASQSISKNVYYIPVSATGVSPKKDSKTGDYLVPTSSISPIWCEVPLLIALAHRAPDLVKAGQLSATGERTSQSPARSK
jgi:hypothetical protein